MKLHVHTSPPYVEVENRRIPCEYVFVEQKPSGVLTRYAVLVLQADKLLIDGRPGLETIDAGTHEQAAERALKKARKREKDAEPPAEE